MLHIYIYIYIYDISSLRVNKVSGAARWKNSGVGWRVALCIVQWYLCHGFLTQLINVYPCIHTCLPRLCVCLSVSVYISVAMHRTSYPWISPCAFTDFLGTCLKTAHFVYFSNVAFCSLHVDDITDWVKRNVALIHLAVHYSINLSFFSTVYLCEVCT